jgi:4-hydroxy-tetrahydrodipicolinate synthase
VAGPGRFGSVICAMATPFGPSGELDLDGAARLARWLVDNGNDGLVVAGTTGEGAALSDAEKLDLFRAVREAVTVPVIAGTGSASTAHTVELTRAAAGAGADAALVVTPYYSRPSQAGIEAHFRAAAAASRLPVIAYDIPKRTGREIAPATLIKLAREGTLAALKDATGLPGQTAALIQMAPAGFEVYSGDDALTLAFAAIGAVGVVSVAAHWAGVEIDELLSCVLAGDLDGARRADARLAGSYDFITSDEAPNPLPTKAMCAVLGFDVGGCRLPLGPIPEVLKERATAVLADLERSRAGI